MAVITTVSTTVIYSARYLLSLCPSRPDFRGRKQRHGVTNPTEGLPSNPLFFLAPDEISLVFNEKKSNSGIKFLK